MHFWTSLVVGAMLLSTIAVQLHKDKMLEGEIAQPYRFVFFASAATLYSATGMRPNIVHHTQAQEREREL